MGRVVEKFLNPCKGTLQERATMEILDELQRAYQPKGLMIIVKGKHHCITHRGIKKDSYTITSQISGLFEQIPARQEMLSLLRL